MKILILITLALALPQAYAAFNTTSKSSQEIEQQNDTLLALKKPAFESLIVEFEKIYPSIKTPINRIASDNRGGKLKEIAIVIKNNLQDAFKKLENPFKKLDNKGKTNSDLLDLAQSQLFVLKNPEETKKLEDLKKIILNQVLTLGDLKAFISALDAYANGRMNLPRLASPLDEIYAAVKDPYKNLYQVDIKINEAQNGKEQTGNVRSTVVRSPQHKLADAFLQALIISIIKGEFTDYLIPVITSSLELEAAEPNYTYNELENEKAGY